MRRRRPLVVSLRFLQLWLSPILTRDYLSTVLCVTPAFQFICIVVCGRPVVRQLLSGLDVSHGEKHDLTLYADVWIARVIAEDHAPIPLLGIERTNEQVFCDLDFSRTE